MAIATVPLHPLFAAELAGIDLRLPPAPDTRRAVESAMDRYAVTVLRDQQIDDEQQLRFTRIFGDLELAPHVRGRLAQPDARARIRHREIFDAGNLDDYGAILPPSDDRRNYSLANRQWHTDSSFRQVSATYSLLSARLVPPQGADTEFADTRSAYDALPAAMKARLDGLVAEHSIWHSRAQLGGYQPSEEERRLRPPAQHPLVRVIPGSGRKALFIGAHASHILGWPLEEGRALLAELIAHATQPQFVYCHKWRSGDLVIWDNRCTMHRATPYEDTAYPRDLRRTTVRDAAAVAAAL